MKKKYLVNDLVVMEDVCNANCQYCLTSGSEFKEKHHLNMADDKPEFHLDKLKLEENIYRDGSRLKDNLKQLLDHLDRAISPYILKISGGEIFLVKGIMDFIREAATKYKRIQILTNGTLLTDEIIRELSKINNLSMQISLDGHAPELNRYRSSSTKVLQRIKENIRKCCVAGLNTEINCVLTDTNIEGIYSFAEYLSRYENVLFLPYPVRGPYIDKFIPAKTQLGELKRLIEDYTRFQCILPPRMYFEELYRYLQTGIIGSPCLVPQMILQSFDDGIISPCPNVWFISLGNMLKEEAQTIGKIERGQLPKIVMKRRSRVKECTNCFTPWEIINLYLRNKISDGELSAIFLYNDESILRFLKERKERAGIVDES